MKKLFITGNIGKDAELKTSQNGKSYARFNVGVYNGKENDHQKTLWVQCTIFGESADRNIAKLTKGAKICAIGNPDLNIYEKDGKTNCSMTMNVDSIEFFTKQQESPTPQEQPKHEEEYGF